MSNVNEYKDIVAFHPGYYIADIIEDMGISQAEFHKVNLQQEWEQRLRL